MAQHSRFSHNTVATSDGSHLSYYTIGTGPGLIILHGSMSHALTHSQLAEALSASYTVHLLSRRERGLSGAYPGSVKIFEPVLHRAKPNDPGIKIGGEPADRTYSKDFSAAVLETDLKDLNLLIEVTESVFVLGVSTGAIVMLAACVEERKFMPAWDTIQKIVIFEPPFQFEDVDTGLDIRGLNRYEDEIIAGDIAGALVTAMKLVQLGPSWIPRPIMKVISSMMLHFQAPNPQASKQDEGNVSMPQLAPILRYDFAVVEHMVRELESFENIGRRALLLGGTASPRYTKIVMDNLEKTVQDSRRVSLKDVGHEVLCNREMRGDPAKGVSAIKSFLG